MYSTFRPFINPKEIPSVDQALASDTVIGLCPKCGRELIPEKTCSETSRNQKGKRRFICMGCRSTLTATPVLVYDAPLRCENDTCKWTIWWTKEELADMIQGGYQSECPKCHQVQDVSSYPIPEGYEWTELGKIMHEATIQRRS